MRSIVVMSLALMLLSCSPKIVPLSQERSIITHVRDSLAEVSVEVAIPTETDSTSMSITPLVQDTAYVQTSVAKASAWVGEDSTLNVLLENRSEKKLEALAKVYVPVTTVTDICV